MKVLVVDDDPGVVAGLVALASELGFEVTSAETVAGAREKLVSFGPQLVLTDLVLPDGDGLDVVRAVAGEPTCDVVVLTGHATVSAAVEAMKAGAYDFLPKPAKPAHLASLLSRVASRLVPQGEAVVPGEEERFGLMVGSSEAMREVFRRLQRVARSEAPVMLRGESGTGKEVAAQTIHLLSRRRGRPFVAINCGALSPTLIESELFGHERGSFTGADRRRAGVFETASGGTLFLDEVTEMPTELQVKLLRVLESRSFRRVGGNEDLDTDVRIVSSTNRDVDEAVRKETFRSDLFYRLDVFPIQLPSLRDRPEDVGALARHFLAAIDELEKNGIRAIEPDAVEALGAHGWPGNVRELRNVLHRCYLLSDPPAVTADTVRQVLGERRGAPLAARPATVADGAAVGIRVGDSLAEAERKLLLATLEHVNGNKRAVAEILGLSLKTVYNKLREYGAGG